MAPDQMSKVSEMRRLLTEAYKDYFVRGNGHRKSGEGYVEVYYPNYFEDGETMRANGVGDYSYVLGPARMHHWRRGEGPSELGSRWTGIGDPFDAALSDIRQWHAYQMAWRPGAEDA